MSGSVEVTRNEKYEYFNNGRESRVEESSEKYERSTSGSTQSPSKTVEKVQREHSSSVRVNGKSVSPSSMRPLLPPTPWRYEYDYYLPPTIRNRLTWKLDHPKFNALL